MNMAEPLMHCMCRVAAITAMLCTASTVHADATQRVVNGNFETGDFAGWTTNPLPADIDPLTFGVDMAGPRNGFFSAYLGTANQAYASIAQTFETTVDTHYRVSFYLDSVGTRGAPASFTASFGGRSLLSLSDSDADIVFRSFTFDVVASSSSTEIRFRAFNVNAFYTLDDVSVTPIDEPGSLSLWAAGLAWIAARRLQARA